MKNEDQVPDAPMTDRRKLQAIHSFATVAWKWGSDASDRAYDPKLDKMDELERWINRAAIFEAALEMVMGYLKVIKAEAVEK